MTRWTFVIAYYNEADFLGTTLAALAAQTVPFRLVLVDNGSTDGSDKIAQAFAATGVEVVNLSEARPGKIHALETAMGALTTEFCAFGDADTFYPPHYLAEAERAFDADPRTVAVMALGVDASRQRLRRAFYAGIVTKLLSKQTHTGGYGQAFRTSALMDAGGFSEAQWPYVLLDHEIMQRVMKLGRVVYPFNFWAKPSPRRSDRRRVRWTLTERLLYHTTPFAAKDWYFYRFLGPRLKARGITHLNLRDKPWETKA
ncbi:glycosyltransferase family 2 protein [Sphingomonas hankookensis]|uniref:glycosyltransferase family 2 protein n=1 Tax=Sphingomonas hankookensis TaxID=563996 RepID=UPI001F598930|nr:glycosyltransferase family A protein [Sphingomonas hankookensis]